MQDPKHCKLILHLTQTTSCFGKQPLLCVCLACRLSSPFPPHLLTCPLLRCFQDLPLQSDSERGSGANPTSVSSSAWRLDFHHPVSLFPPSTVPFVPQHISISHITSLHVEYLLSRVPLSINVVPAPSGTVEVGKHVAVHRSTTIFLISLQSSCPSSFKRTNLLRPLSSPPSLECRVLPRSVINTSQPAVSKIWSHRAGG